MSLVRQATAEAVGEAAGANCFRDQITDAGLEPWRARQAYAACRPPRHGGRRRTRYGQLAPALGRSPAEAASAPRGLLCDDFAPSPATLCFQPLGSSMPPVQPVPLAPPVPHPEDRRDEPGPAANRNETAPLGRATCSAAWRLRRAVRRGATCRLPLARPAPRRPARWTRWLAPPGTRYVRAILERSLRDGASGEPLLAKLGELTRDLDRQAAGEILYQLANHYYRHGQWPSEAEAFGALADRYPDHALTPLAIRWLLRYYSSGEAAWRVQRDAAGQTRRLQCAVAIGRYVERGSARLVPRTGHPVPLGCGYRGLGDARAAERLYQAQADSRDGWWRGAQGELAIGRVPLVPHLAQPVSQRPARPVLCCVRARTRPRLDGRLDEAVWRDAAGRAGKRRQHDDADWPAIVMLAYDDQYLYLAAQCRSRVPPAQPVPHLAQPVAHPARPVPHRLRRVPHRLLPAAPAPGGLPTARRSRGRDARRRPFGLRPRRVHVRHRPRFRHLLPFGGRSPRLDFRSMLGRPDRGTRNGSSPPGSSGQLDGGGRYRAEGVDRQAAPAGGRLGAGRPAGRARRRFSIVDHSGRGRQPYCPTGLDTWYFSRKAVKSAEVEQYRKLRYVMDETCMPGPWLVRLGLRLSAACCLV